MPLVDHLVEPLETHLDGVAPDPDAHLFSGSRGGPLAHSHWLRSVWKPAWAAAGIVGVTPHALRHSTGKMLANAGVPTVVIKLIMGHASASFTMDIYGHESQDDFDAAAEALGDYRRRSMTRRVSRIDPTTGSPHPAAEGNFPATVTLNGSRTSESTLTSASI